MLNSLITRRAAEGVIRHVITAFGALLVSRGYLDEGTADQLAGALMIIFGLLWSALDKRDG